MFDMIKFMLDEEWKTIEKFNNYSISNYGRVKRLKTNRILKSGRKPKGYLHVSLSQDGIQKNCSVHRLVAEAFLGPCPKNKEVNHIDGNKEHNYDFNLQYVTHKENMNHASRNGLIKKKFGANNHRSKLTISKVRKIRKLYKTGKYIQDDLAKKFNISICLTGKVVREEVWNYV